MMYLNCIGCPHVQLMSVDLFGSPWCSECPVIMGSQHPAITIKERSLHHFPHKTDGRSPSAHLSARGIEDASPFLWGHVPVGGPELARSPLARRRVLPFHSLSSTSFIWQGLQRRFKHGGDKAGKSETEPLAATNTVGRERLVIKTWWQIRSQHTVDCQEFEVSPIY